MWTRGYLRAGHLSTMVQEGPPSRATRCYLLTKWIWLSHITIAIHWHYFAIHHKSTKCPPEWALILPLLPYAFAIFNVSIVIKCHLILLHCCPMILHYLMLSWNVCLKGLLFFKMFPLPHCHQISVCRGPLFFKTASAESLSSTSRAASMMSRVQGITHERDESESDERDNTRSTRNTREKIPELEMIDQSTGGDLFLMFLGQGRSEFAWQTCLQT